MRRLVVLTVSLVVLAGCLSVRQTQPPSAAQFKVLTYNVNWGGAKPELAAQIIRQCGADIVCLQETTPQWEQFLRRELARDYSFAEFRDSEARMGGGLAFFSRLKAGEVAYIPSDCDWFDGWIMAFETSAGPVQVLNVHLRPPISDGGSWVSGYFTTGNERLREMQRFYAKRDPSLPMLIAGDFNDTEDSAVLRWLEGKGMTNALPQFDRYSPTWQWKTSVGTLRRRMDHIVYSDELSCSAARVISEGASDHFPVEAVFSLSAAQ